LKVIYE